MNRFSFQRFLIAWFYKWAGRTAQLRYQKLLSRTRHLRRCIMWVTSRSVCWNVSHNVNNLGPGGRSCPTNNSVVRSGEDKWNRLDQSDERDLYRLKLQGQETAVRVHNAGVFMLSITVQGFMDGKLIVLRQKHSGIWLICKLLFAYEIFRYFLVSY